MSVTEIGRSGVALLLSPSGAIPRYIAIGTGSKTETQYVTTMGSLYLTQVFSARDITTFKNVLWRNDFSSVQMSGANFKEFALMTGSPAQEPWHYVNFGNGLQFDGSNELRIELSWKIF